MSGEQRDLHFSAFVKICFACLYSPFSLKCLSKCWYILVCTVDVCIFIMHISFLREHVSIVLSKEFALVLLSTFTIFSS